MREPTAGKGAWGKGGWGSPRPGRGDVNCVQGHGGQEGGRGRTKGQVRLGVKKRGRIKGGRSCSGIASRASQENRPLDWIWSRQRTASRGRVWGAVEGGDGGKGKDGKGGKRAAAWHALGRGREESAKRRAESVLLRKNTHRPHLRRTRKGGEDQVGGQGEEKW